MSTIQYKTAVKTYRSDASMKRGIAKMQRQGWEVVSVSTVDQGWAKGKTCCLAIIFLPLLIFGRKGSIKQVVYRKPK